MWVALFQVFSDALVLLLYFLVISVEFVERGDENIMGALDTPLTDSLHHRFNSCFVLYLMLPVFIVSHGDAIFGVHFPDDVFP